MNATEITEITEVDAGGAGSDAPAQPVLPVLLPLLWSQTHALRALADLLDHARIEGLSVTVHPDGSSSVQVPRPVGGSEHRVHLVACLAGAIGGHLTQRSGPGTGDRWITSDGCIGGHLIHVFTLIDPQGDPS